MPRTPRLLLLLIAAIAPVGCDTVSSVHPIGVVSERDLAASLDGVWINPDDEKQTPIQLRYLGEGDLAIAAVKWDNKARGFEMQSCQARLLEDDGVLYFNVRPNDLNDEEPTEDGRRYGFARVTIRDDGGLQVAGPNVEAFSAAVEAGKLKGEVKRDERTDVIIRSDAAQLNAFIDPDQAPQQFNLEDASLLRRIAHPKD
jgi:hypothetical protein